MHVLALFFGSLFVLVVALDAFQTIILPRRPTGRWRLTRFFYKMTWAPWVALGARIESRKRREQFYSVFGPSSLLLLLAVWAAMLAFGFALMYFGLGTPFVDPMNGHGGPWENLRTDLYVSGTTLFTLGLGDVVPHGVWIRVLIVLEAGTGLGFVAMVIGYLPVIYQAFSRRETSVALLDGRAGSPPTATELLRRHGYEGGEDELIELLAEWERWSAEILESHISYPILCYYRSQHDNQSWLSALVAILDASALLITIVEGKSVRQAQLTFAMARHALIDLGHVFHVESTAGEMARAGVERLPSDRFHDLCEALGEMHMRLCGDPASMRRLTAIRLMYEPHAQALSDYLLMPLPLWVAEEKKAGAWEKVSDLRALQEESLRAIEHVSSRSAANHLHDEEHGF